MKWAWLLAVAAATPLVGCGTTTVVHTVTAAAGHAPRTTDTSPAPHVAVGPPNGAGTFDCGAIGGVTVYGGPNTSCAFARNVYKAAVAFFHEVGADAAHLIAYSPVTGKRYRLTCEINSADQVNCSTDSGALISFQAFTAPPQSSAQTNNTSTPPQTDNFSGNGSTTLAPITIPDSTLSWTDDGGLFQILTDGINVNSQGSSGSTFVPAGTYTIDVNAIGNWTINLAPSH
jgi:hypothetical protein